jgi:hypothetical protein
MPILSLCLQVFFAERILAACRISGVVEGSFSALMVLALNIFVNGIEINMDNRR